MKLKAPQNPRTSAKSAFIRASCCCRISTRLLEESSHFRELLDNSRSFHLLDVALVLRANLRHMEVTLRIPDRVAARLAAAGGDVSRQALEALALEGYRDETLTLYEVSEMLGLSRVETEDFLGQHHVALAAIGESELDREGALFSPQRSRNRTVPGNSGDAGSRRKPR